MLKTKPLMPFLGMLTLVVSLALAGCSSPNANANAVKLQTSVQLSWSHEYSTSPFYSAEKNGHFAAQNLEVKLEQGGFIDGKYVEPIDQVLDGKFDFGLTNASALLSARAQAKPVVAVATIYQRSPQAVIALPRSGIKRPQDLKGKKVAMNAGGTTQIFEALLVSQGMKLSDVIAVSRKTFGVEPLMNGEVDAMVGWSINEGVQVQEAGQVPTYIMFSDYGVDTYNVLLVTTEKMIKENPDKVERFVRATLKGIQDVVANPEQAIDYTLAYGKGLDRAAQLRRLQAAIPLFSVPGVRAGVMDPNNWKVSQQILLDQHVLDKPIDLNAAYTLDFTNRIYAK
jgi:NitT/TauT family transport system substrate-binding protein